MHIYHINISIIPTGGPTTRMTAGLLPLALGAFGPPSPMYESKYLRWQLRSALCDDPLKPFDVWLWLAGNLDAHTLHEINKTKVQPGGAADYTSLLYAYSSHNANGTDLCSVEMS